MKNYISIFLLVTTIFSCQTRKKNEKVEYPFKKMELDSLVIEWKNNQTDTVKVLEKTELTKVERHFARFSTLDLVKGKGLHGARTICNITLFANGGGTLVNIQNHSSEGVVASIFEERKNDNFHYFLGSLYDADNTLEMFETNFYPGSH